MSMWVRKPPPVMAAEVELSELRLALTGVIDEALQRAASPELKCSAALLDVLLDLRRDLLDTLDLEEMLAAAG
jgi:hypothetical protein